MVKCPYCGGFDCKHFLGWTYDDETYGWSFDSGSFDIPKGAQIVHSSTSAEKAVCGDRVYFDGHNPRMVRVPHD